VQWVGLEHRLGYQSQRQNLMGAAHWGLVPNDFTTNHCLLWFTEPVAHRHAEGFQKALDVSTRQERIKEESISPKWARQRYQAQQIDYLLWVLRKE
jgi:hypothetical protein